MPRQTPDEPEEQVRRDRREHGGAPMHLDDDSLAHRTEEERVDAGLDPYDPDEVPPATDAPLPPPDVTETDQYLEEKGEIEHELDEDEIRVKGERDPFPPTRYDRT